MSGWLDSQDTRSSLDAVCAVGGTFEFQGSFLKIEKVIYLKIHHQKDLGFSFFVKELCLGILKLMR